jgi:hypothetical protein
MSTPIIICLLIVALLVIYVVINKLSTSEEKTEASVPAYEIKKFKPAKPAKPAKSSASPVTSGTTSGAGKPLGKIEAPSAPSVTEPIKTKAKHKAKKPAAKKSKKPKNNGDQLLHS